MDDCGSREGDRGVNTTGTTIFFTRNTVTLITVQENLFHPTRSVVVPFIEKFPVVILNTYREKISDIILFGSVARGEDTNESDIDLLIIGNEDDWQ